MENLSQRELKQLAGVEASYCVTILMPTHRAGRDNMQDAIRLKNLASAAEAQLKEAGLSSREASDFLLPLRELLEDQDFWLHQADGLAIFLSPDEGMRRYRLPYTLPETLLIGERFHVVPLVPVVAENGRYLVLALSPDRIRLLECSRYRVEQRRVEGMPENIEEILRLYEESEHVISRGAQAVGRGPRQQHSRSGGAVFHGQGEGGNDLAYRNMRWHEYCNMISAALARELAEETAPMVLASSEEIGGVYRQENKYKHLLDDYVKGNPDGWSDVQLRDAAWEIVAPEVTAARDALLDRYGEGLAHARASHKLDQIFSALQEGRVQALFLAKNQQRWGHFDPVGREVLLRETPQNGDEELLNLAAAQAYSTDAQVFVLNPQEMPEPQYPMAAVFRW